jgi:hypothetical protein
LPESGNLRRSKTSWPAAAGAAAHQDDLETPGISPRSASPRKHRRQIPNLRRKPRGRPQIRQRLCRRLENLAFLCKSFWYFAIVDMLPF